MPDIPGTVEGKVNLHRKTRQHQNSFMHIKTRINSNMSIKLDSNTVIGFPNLATWAKLYARLAGPLAASLNRGYCRADREDAVEAAFQKCMWVKDPASYDDPPQTERDWFFELRWQARAYLSHLREHAEVVAEYKESMAEELKDAFAEGHQGSGLDAETFKRALVRALETLRREQDLSRRNLNIYLALEVRGESVKDVARRYRLKENNVYVISHRTRNIVMVYGPDCFRRALGDEGWGAGSSTLPFAA